jgi:molybdopterin-guanine dinucleotide biosynthesis protein A
MIGAAGWYDAGVSQCQGFVLCGGGSRRMGRDKALLPISAAGEPLLVHVARVVAVATGSATLVGPRDRYGELGWPLVEDDPPGDGPLGGVIAALGASAAERCLIVACDMPWLSVDGLRAVLDLPSSADVVAIRSERGLEPLCAVYDRRCLPVLRGALAESERALYRVLRRLEVDEVPIADSRMVFNANTPADWAAVEAGG